MDKQLDTSVRYLKGIGEAKAKLFEKLGVKTLRDLVEYYPRTYEDRRKVKMIADLAEGDEVCVIGMVMGGITEYRKSRNFSIQSMSIADESGKIKVTWFNSPFLKDTFKNGDRYVFYGKVTASAGRRQITTPIYEKIEKDGVFTGRIVPTYSLTGGLTQKILVNAVESALKSTYDEIEEWLPLWLRKKYELAEARYAIRNIHFPDNPEAYFIARRRLVFEEFFLMQLGLMAVKGVREELKGIKFTNPDVADEFIKTLPFEMTNAQKRAVVAMTEDLKGIAPMNRLVQGDVGCGKTVVAATGLFIAAKNGYQSVLMAPTEILAYQHYQEIKSLFEKHGITCALLSGSVKGKAKKELLLNIAEGNVDVVIGTHALIQEGVEYKNLAFIVTDEQHRFGVRQRMALSDKGENPHVMVMTATPIPRTLAMLLYGDLDSSVIDELPPGRQKVDTYAVGEDMRKRIYAFIEKQIVMGHQAYIVCPMVEESDKAELKAVTEYAKTLQETIFPHRRVGFVHGKMKSEEKDNVMGAFANGDVDILVSTTVIEVGVNVPNATLMVIENAERFGLSQLHQLRGRVGRGKAKAYCVIFSDSDNEISRKRVEIMTKTNDGFVISEEDLKMRGPGEFFGTRQHGLPELKIANLFEDRSILEETRKAVKDLTKADIKLANEENEGIKRKIKQMFEDPLVFS